MPSTRADSRSMIFGSGHQETDRTLPKFAPCYQEQKLFGEPPIPVGGLIPTISVTSVNLESLAFRLVMGELI